MPPDGKLLLETFSGKVIAVIPMESHVTVTNPPEASLPSKRQLSQLQGHQFFHCARNVSAKEMCSWISEMYEDNLTKMLFPRCSDKTKHAICVSQLKLSRVRKYFTVLPAAKLVQSRPRAHNLDSY